MERKCSCKFDCYCAHSVTRQRYVALPNPFAKAAPHSFEQNFFFLMIDHPDRLDFPGLLEIGHWFSELRNEFRLSKQEFENCNQIFREKHGNFQRLA